MLRAIILSLILFVAFGTLIPIATEFSEASVKTQKRKYQKKSRAKKYRKQARRKKARSRRTKKKRRLMSNAAWRRFTARRRARNRLKRKRQIARSRSRKRSRKRKSKAKKPLMSNAAWRRFTAKRRAKRRATARRKSKVTRRKSSKRSSVARKSTRKKSRSSKKRVRKYSKKWWASYRAKQKRQKAAAARKRAIRLKSIRAAKKKRSKSSVASVRKNKAGSSANPVRTKVQSSEMPVQQVALGDVSVDVIGAATGATVSKGKNTLVGGVPTTTLRRTVIDQMIRDSGWVENDYHKEIAGKKVYVVVAKAPDKNNVVQSRTYFFTESNGRIYRVATRSPRDGSDSAEKRSEDAIRRLNIAARPQQAKKQ